MAISLWVTWVRVNNQNGYWQAHGTNESPRSSVHFWDTLERRWLIYGIGLPMGLFYSVPIKFSFNHAFTDESDLVGYLSVFY